MSVLVFLARDAGTEAPTILLTNNPRDGPVALITRYAHRMLIENGIAEAIHFFQLDALTSMVELKVDFDLQITLILAYSRPRRARRTLSSPSGLGSLSTTQGGRLRLAHPPDERNRLA